MFAAKVRLFIVGGLNQSGSLIGSLAGGIHVGGVPIHAADWQDAKYNGSGANVNTWLIYDQSVLCFGGWSFKRGIFFS
jgi:hypothetical protein